MYGERVERSVFLLPDAVCLPKWTLAIEFITAKFRWVGRWTMTGRGTERWVGHIRLVTWVCSSPRACDLR